MGRVIVETDPPALVSEVTGRSLGFSGGYVGGALGQRSLCTSPCFVDLPVGPHELRFTSNNDQVVSMSRTLNVTSETTVLRTNLGLRSESEEHQNSTLTVFLAGLGGMTVGGAIAGATVNSSEAYGFAFGAIIGGAGLIATIVSAVMFHSEDTLEPESSTEWALSGPTPAPVAEVKATAPTTTTAPKPSPKPVGPTQAVAASKAVPAPKSTSLALKLEVIESDGLRLSRAPSALSQLQVGDLLLSIDGALIAGLDELERAQAKLHPGDKVSLVVLRKGKPVEIAAVLPR